MNEWKVTAKRIGTQHIAIVRRVDRAEPYPLSEKGTAILYASATEAELAGLRHILHLLNTEIRFEVAPYVPPAAALQEKVFGDVKSRKGKLTKVRRIRRRSMKRAA